MRTLLELEKQVDRPIVNIFGIAYEMRSPYEFSVEDQYRFRHYCAEYQRLDLHRGEPPKSLIAKARLALDRLLAICLVDLPDNVRDELSDFQKQQIVGAFTELFPENMLQAGRAATMEQKANGETMQESTSADSRGSTAAIPNGG